MNKNSTHNNLFQLKAFWLSISIPILLALVLSVFFFFKLNLSMCYSDKCFEYFWTLFRLPIGIASLAIPFAAIVASNHRTQQTAESIRVSMQNNNFSNYYKHREVFFETLKELENRYNINFSNKSKLYRRLFPSNSPDIFKHISELKRGNPIVEVGKLVEEDQDFKRYLLSNKLDDDRFIKLLTWWFVIWEVFNISHAENTPVVMFQAVGVAYKLPLMEGPNNTYGLSNSIARIVYSELCKFCHIENNIDWPDVSSRFDENVKNYIEIGSQCEVKSSEINQPPLQVLPPIQHGLVDIS
ncbi:hypothetical protein [Catenovulum adriaticum]|uniref:Uncharacterized protein n=1 Tax=Catenovulum adriaticum TaxID=2984846 RepID=A0ABY7AQ96_9ALTE|nr:hypothetical protein [Catenovulum sp. TS8]WAJ71447.1 hypothetical protein OLW01_06525 [Catenovulum sp. TS8]